MSGICSAHPHHEPGCRLCEWAQSMGAELATQEEMLRWLAGLFDLPYDPETVIRRQLARIEQTIVDCDEALATAADERRAQLEGLKARCLVRRDEYVWWLGRRLQRQLGATAPAAPVLELLAGERVDGGGRGLDDAPRPA